MVSESRKEELSALMDGEASELELRRILKDLDANDELGASWSRYHTVRAVLRKEPKSEWSGLDISSRIMDAIDAEPAHQAAVPIMKKKASWFATWVGQSAIAAGVAAAVVVAWQPWQQVPGSAPMTAVNAAPAKLNTSSMPKLPLDQRALMEASSGGPIAPRIRAIPVAGDDDALNPYIVSHAGASVLMEQVGVPAARVINVSVGEGTAQ
ncbi:MAG TPA: sigma-E factor negative regulatory protein [Pseudomonadales bacterium]|nr:sigma-E factor negative regulatory protein [Pseudomonadales bacterium]